MEPGRYRTFEPDNDNDAADYEYQGKATIWKNIYLFVDAFRFNSLQGREITVRSNLHSCLRGIAQRWYTEELENTTRLAFRFAPEGIGLWTKHLIECFKNSVPSAVKKLWDEVYTEDDALNGRDVRGYAAIVMRHAKAADMDKTHQ
jgi:hypothetical protein